MPLPSRLRAALAAISLACLVPRGAAAWGDDVLIVDPLELGGVADPWPALSATYEGLGAAVDVVGSLPGSLADYRLVFLVAPDGAFNLAEATLVNGFLAEGGRVVAMGEFDAFAASNGHLNDLAALLGFGVAIVDDGVNEGCLQGDSVSTNEVMHDVTRFSGGGHSVVDPGASGEALVRFTTLDCPSGCDYLAVEHAPDGLGAPPAPGGELFVVGDSDGFKGCVSGDNDQLWENLWDYLPGVTCDADGDEWLAAECGGNDCDDADPDVSPGVDVVTSGYCSGDHDCNGLSDADNDGDGYVRELSCAGDDCSDVRPERNPGAYETVASGTCFDGVDNDCDGVANGDEDECVALCAGVRHVALPEVFEEVDISDSGDVNVLGDGEEVTLQLPFDFRFYDTDFPAGTQVRVTDDGALVWDGLAPRGDQLVPGQGLTGNPFPAAAGYGRFAAPWLADWDGATIHRQIDTSGCDPKWTLQWDARHASGAGPYSFQLVLQGGSHFVYFRYLDATAGSPLDGGSDTTYGATQRISTGISWEGVEGGLSDGSEVQITRTADLSPSGGPMCTAVEVCDDGVDNDGDCDADAADTEHSDPDQDGTAFQCDACEDADGDGYGVDGGAGACAGPDCDDGDEGVNPAAVEVCDGVDQDCDGAVDDGLDGDGDGTTPCAGDCDDGDAAIGPGAEERCDGVDQDCDGVVPPAEADGDGDGYAPCGGDCDDAAPGVLPDAPEGCDGVDTDCDGVLPPAEQDGDGDGYAGCTECDDGDAAVHPGAIEVCDGADNDCEPTTDEDGDGDGDGVSICEGDCDDTDDTYYPGAEDFCGDERDNDCDGFADDFSDADGDGSRVCEGDCDDADAAVNPDAVEVCGDGVDNDCDARTDEGFDGDGDGWLGCGGDCDDADAGVSPAALEVCGNGVDDDCDGETDESGDADGDGFAACDGDCDDADAAANPGAVDDTCDGVDSDCDGVVDGGVPDADGDGFRACDDCDDAQAAAHPGAVEVCDDGVDNDCDGEVDEETDADGDGYGSCNDCNDADANWNPFADEICDGLDNDCDGAVPPAESDHDGDGFRACDECDDDDPLTFPGADEVCDGHDNDCDDVLPEDEAIDADGDGSPLCADCDDAEPLVHPGAVEVCDDLDNDCDGEVDEEDVDADGDGYGTCDGDCDDTDSAVNPGAEEICDGRDTDCDGALTPGDEDLDGDGDLACEDCDDQDSALDLADADGDGFDTCSGDCDDHDDDVHPAAVEVCGDGLDNDCDGLIDVQDPACQVDDEVHDWWVGGADGCACDGSGTGARAPAEGLGAVGTALWAWRRRRRGRAPRGVAVPGKSRPGR